MPRGERGRSVASIAAVAIAFLVFQQVVFPAPSGIVVQGVLIGGLTALIAFGIALVYRANRIVNFAQGDLGLVPTVVVVLLMTYVSLPYAVALPLGLVLAIGLGALLEIAIIRRFRRAPRLLLTVATLGIAQALTAASLALPALLRNLWPATFTREAVPAGFDPPFDLTWRVDPIAFDANDLIALITVIVSIAGISWFLRRTNIGAAIRASAESADRAFLLGINVRRIQTIVWALAGALAFVAIFMRAGVLGLPLGEVLGPAILVRALAACVIGRMERLGHIFVAAIALGVLEQAIVWDTGSSALVTPILFAVVMGALILHRQGPRRRADDQSQWLATSDVRPVPTELAHLPEVRWVGRGLVAALAAIALALPVILPESRTNLLGLIVIFAIVALSLVVLTGWAGQVSLGQVAFVGIGAAVGGWCTSVQQWDLVIALVAAGVVGAALAVVIGLPALRMRGLHLAVATLAFAHVTSTYLLDKGEFAWLPEGRLPRNDLLGLVSIESETQYFYFSLAVLALVLLSVRRLRNSRVGRVMIGVRENERAAQSYGVNATSAKLTAFAFSGFIAALAGALFAHHQQSLGITAYATEESLVMFTMVVIGGLGSVPGALLGAAYVQGAKYFMPAELAFFAGGVGLLLVLIVLPGGLGGAMYQLRDGYLRKVAERRKILVPSLVADARSVDVITSTGRERGLAMLRQLADVMDAANKVHVK